MAPIKKSDLKILIEVEDLLHKKLAVTNGKKDVYKGEEYIYFDENDEEFNLWCKYNTLIEKFICDYEKIKKKSAKFNKDNAEYHRISNNLCAARKKNDKERIAYYEDLMKKYKEKKSKKQAIDVLYN